MSNVANHIENAITRAAARREDPEISRGKNPTVTIRDLQSLKKSVQIRTSTTAGEQKMWLVQTLLSDHWFDDFRTALTFYSSSTKTRTYPRLDGEWPTTADAFQEVIRP